MATQVGEAVIKLSFDGKDIKASLNNVSSEAEKSGRQAGGRFGDALSVAAGSLISKGISKAISAVTSNIDKAISRVDTLNNFPRIMTNLGVSSEDASKSIAKMSDKLMGLPTTLDAGASAVQRFTSRNGDVAKSTDIFLALNNAILAGGQSTEIQQTAMEQLSQAYAKGKPDMIEWKSAMTAMPAQLKQVAIAMGYGEDGVEALGEALRSGEVTMDDFMDTISKLNTKGVNGFKNFEDQAKDATNGIQTAISVMNSRITQGIAEVIDTIGQDRIAEIATGIGNAFKEAGKVIAGVVNFIIDNWGTIEPIVKVVGGIAGTILAINVALKAYHKIQGAVNAIAGVFGKTIDGISGGISKATQVFNKSPIGGAAKKVGEIFKSLSETIKTALVSLKDTLVTVVQGLKDILVALAEAIVEPIKTLLTGLGQAIAGFFTALADPAIAMGALMFAAGAAAVAAAIFLIGSAIGAVMPALTDLFNNVIIPVAQFIVDTVLVLIDSLTTAIINLTQQALIPLGEFLVNSFVTIIQTVADVITNLTNNALVPLIDTLSGAFTDIINAIANLLTGVLNAALQGIAEIIRAVGDGFLKMGEAIKTALEGVQGVLQVFADLIKSIAAAAVAIVAMVTGHSINYGSGYAHLFAQGGKVEGPGTSTSDSIPAMLSDGEYVIRASSAKAIGYDTLDMLNEGKAWSGDLMSDLGSHFTTQATSGRIINVYMTNKIDNILDADEIGQVMMESIRRAA